jgi:hypothetical protein
MGPSATFQQLQQQTLEIVMLPANAHLNSCRHSYGLVVRFGSPDVIGSQNTVGGINIFAQNSLSESDKSYQSTSHQLKQAALARRLQNIWCEIGCNAAAAAACSANALAAPVAAACLARVAVARGVCLKELLSAKGSGLPFA